MDSMLHAEPALDEIGLRDLYRIAWQRKWVVLSGAIVGCLLALVAALVVPKEYEAQIVVAPVANSGDEGQLGGLTALASAVGGLSSLAGLSVPGNTKKAETIAVLQSTALTEKFIATNKLLPVLYRKDWDSQRMAWKPADPGKVPTLWKANRMFARRIRKVTTDAKTGLVTVSIEWTNPEQAAAWANGLVKMTDDYLRNEAIATSERDIAFLKQEASNTDIVGVKQAIYSLTEKELSKEMLARGTKDYALNVIDPAQAPQLPSSPSIPLWTIAGGLFGIVIAFLLAIVVPERATPMRPAPAQHSGADADHRLPHGRIGESPPY